MPAIDQDPRASMLIPLEIRHRVTIDEYHRMAETSVYPDGTPIELLDGVLVDKARKDHLHVICSELLQLLLQSLVPTGYFLSIGNPISIPQSDSEPEPDATIVRGAIRDYTGRYRGPSDVPLVIEVAQGSYSLVRQYKWSIYGAAGVPILWIVDLNRKRLEVFTDPAGPSQEPGFQSEHVYGPDDEVPLILDGREVARIVVRDLLP